MDQVERMDHGGQAGARIHEGRDHVHVSQLGLFRQQRLWHQGRGRNLLRQGTGRPDRGRERHPGRHGQQTDPLQSGAQSGQVPGPPQLRHLPDGESRLPDQGAAGFHPADSH